MAGCGRQTDRSGTSRTRSSMLAYADRIRTGGWAGRAAADQARIGTNPQLADGQQDRAAS
jgi:hypothetical protein